MSLIAPLLMAGGTLGSALVSNSANRRATNASVDASNAAMAEQRRQFDMSRGDLEPYRRQGANALMALSGQLIDSDPNVVGGMPTMRNTFAAPNRAMTGAADAFTGRTASDMRTFEDGTRGLVADMNRAQDSLGAGYVDSTQAAVARANEDQTKRFRVLQRDLSNARGGYDDIMAREFDDDPGRQFRIEQGEKAINRGAAARGNVYSGGTMQAIADFNSDLASQEYGNFDARRNRDAVQSFGMDSGIAGDVYGAGMDRVRDRFGRQTGLAQDEYNVGMAGAQGRYDRGYGRRSDVLQGRMGENASVYDATTGTIQNNFARRQSGLNALAGLAGVGQTATNATANLGQSMASNVGNLYGNIGQAQAGGAITGANIFNQGMDNMFGILGAGANGMFGNSWPEWLGGPNSAQTTGRNAANALMGTVNGFPGMM